MTLLAFEPETEIEQQILEARNGDVSGDALIRRMADIDLYIPSTSEVQTDGGGFGPVLLEQNGLSFVAVFTSLSRQPRDIAPYMMQVKGRHFFLRLPPGYGVMFNPGYDAQILLPPQGVAALKEDLRGP
jgi:hypothetical protein